MANRQQSFIAFAVSAGIIAGACGKAGVPVESAARADVVVRGGSLLDMVAAEPRVRSIKGLVVRDGKIERILAADSTDTLPDATRVIHGESLYLLPGLVDSHIHFRPWYPEPAIHYGVTTFMDTAPCPNCAETPDEDANEWILRQQRLLNAPESVGPALYVTGMKLDGPEGHAEANVYVVKAIDEIAERVEFLAALGVSAIKVEEMLPPEFRKRAIEEADERNLPVVGHSRDARESVGVGMKFIEHMAPIARSLGANAKTASERTMDLRQAPGLIDFMVQNRVYLNPTLLARYGYLTERAPEFAEEDTRLLDEPAFADIPAQARPAMLAAFRRAEKMPAAELEAERKGWANVRAFVREFNARGGLLLAGTDETERRVPGISIHREMQLLVDSGVAPYTALLGATRFASDLMRMSDRIGTLEAGKQADIVILGSNPAAQISATKDIRYVIRRGVVLRAPSPMADPEPR